MESGNKTTYVFNVLHNLQGLRPSPPTLGANNMIVDLQVINPTFQPPTFRMVVSVINPTYHIRNLLLNKVTTTKHTKGPANNGVGYPFGGQVVNPLDLTSRRVGLGLHTLAALPPTLNGRLWIVKFISILLG
jgi:hypothetical protein